MPCAAAPHASRPSDRARSLSGRGSRWPLQPAITLGFVATRLIKLGLAAFYWFFQLLGAVCAAFILRGIFNQLLVKFGATPTPHVSDAKVFALEAIMTLFLVWAVWATAVDERGAFK